jgi:drug/metabolite transporter (DMT)-like permease
MQKIKKLPVGVIYALGAALLWGILPIFLKVAVAKIPAITIVWFRFAFSFLSLFLYFALFQRNSLKILIKPPLFSILAGIFLGINYIGFMLGIKYTTPNNAQVFIQLGPVLLAASGFILYKEKVKALQILGFGITILGFILYYSQQVNFFGDDSLNYTKGIFWTILGAIMWAFYSVFQKELVNKHSVLQLNLILFGLSTILFMPLVKFNILLNMDIWQTLIMISLGLNTLLAYTFIALALRYSEANIVSIIVTCNPIITFFIMAILGYLEVWWIMPEKMNLISIAGALFVIGGAALVILFRKN